MGQENQKEAAGSGGRGSGRPAQQQPAKPVAKTKASKAAAEDDDKDRANAEERVALRRQQAASAAEAEAQLAAINALLNDPGFDDDNDNDNDGGAVTAGGGGRNASPKNTNSTTAAMTAVTLNDNDDASIGDVSLHSSDYEDAQLLQGMRDLDEELEEEFQAKTAAIQSQIGAHRAEAVRLLKEVGDRPAAAQELQRGKKLEGELAQLRLDHRPPLSLRLEAAEADMADLEKEIALRKQEALAALKGGNKLTALERMSEAKELEKQLLARRTEFAELTEEKDKMLRGEGS